MMQSINTDQNPLNNVFYCTSSLQSKPMILMLLFFLFFFALIINAFFVKIIIAVSFFIYLSGVIVFVKFALV